MKGFFKKQNTTLSKIEILSEPSGEGYKLKSVLGDGLRENQFRGDAYLSIIRSNSDLRLALFLDSVNFKEVIGPIAEFCHHQIGDIDIFNLNELPPSLSEQVKQRLLPFFLNK